MSRKGLFSQFLKYWKFYKFGNIKNPEIALLRPQVETICENSNHCLYNDKIVDDRLTLEEPGTDWIFTCPKIEWIQNANQDNIWAYQFRANMPIDVSKVEGDMWPSYERCKDLSCHAAELRGVVIDT